MVDVAADDDHGADLGHRPSEARQRHGDEGVAAVPEQRAQRRSPAEA